MSLDRLASLELKIRAYEALSELIENGDDETLFGSDITSWAVETYDTDETVDEILDSVRAAIINAIHARIRGCQSRLETP